jgi:hypothetical protein
MTLLVIEQTQAWPIPVAPGAGTTVGTVVGWRAVFQVAVVGQAVVATAGDGTLYAVGPGTA